MKDVVLALYLPIVVLSLPALWLFATRLLLPLLRARNLDLDRYCIGMSAASSLAAHAVENPYYWLIRAFPERFAWLNQTYVLIGLWKLLIVASCIFALAGLSHAITDRAQLGRLTLLALMLWGIGYVVAVLT